MNTPRHEAHRSFLNAYYRKVSYIYDATRKYYLFGRDSVLEELLRQPWESLVEVGPGTGRNLVKLRGARPFALYGGIEVSDEMLAIARKRCPGMKLEQGFAEDADYTALLGTPPQRILFSYCLSMVQDGDAALRNARRHLAADGRVVVVDFGDLTGLRFMAGVMKWFLGAFHVAAPDVDLLRRHGAEIHWGPGRYYMQAVMGPLDGEGSAHTRREV